MCYKKILASAVLLLLSGVITGCAGSVVDQSAGNLEETFIGNSLALVELKTLKTADRLVPESPNKAYRVDPRVGIEGDYYIFNLYTPHGTYLIKGVAGLVQYAADAEILEMIMASDYGEKVTAALLSSVNYDNNEVLDIKAFNIDSIRGIGRRFNEVYVEDGSETRIVENIIERDAVNGAYYDSDRMILAGKLGLDGYSANIFVQKFLDVMLQLSPEELKVFESVDLVYPQLSSAFGGKNNIDASMQSKALSPGGRSFVLERKLLQYSPAILRSQIYEAFIRMFSNSDISDALIGRLVNSVYYSTREILYIYAYINDMALLNGKKEIINFLAGAENAFNAKQYFLQLQLLHAYFVASGGAERFVALSNMPGLIDKAGQLIVIPVWDHTRDRIAVRKLLVEVKNIRDKYGLMQAGIWFAGDCDKNTVKTANKIGIEVRKSVVLEPAFRFTAYRKLTYLFQNGDPLIKNVVSLTPNSTMLYQRTNRPVPTPLLQENINVFKEKKVEKSTIVIEDPEKPVNTKHDPRNLQEFGFGVKIIPKAEWEAKNGGVQEEDGNSSEEDKNDNDAGSEQHDISDDSGFTPIKESNI